MDNISEIDEQWGVRIAWHKKTKVKEDLSLDDNWLRKWDAVPAPLRMVIGGGSALTYEIPIPDMQLVCSDNPEIRLGHPYNPETYTPLTNEKFLEVIKNAISGTRHKVVSVGSVRRRGRTFVSIAMEGLGEYDTAGHHIEPFLNFGNSFDKSCEFWWNTSGVDSVCDNTVSFNIQKVQRGEGLGESYRHTQGLEAKLPEISDIIDAAVGVHHEFAEAFESLSKMEVREPEAQRVFLGFIVDKEAEEASSRAINMSKRLVTFFTDAPGCKGRDRSDMFSAVTNYYTHGNRSSFRQIHSSEFGFGAQRKREFLGVLTDWKKYDETLTRGEELIKS